MKKLILQCDFSLGDIVMLTAAVRDLHRTYPGRFLTDVRTPCPALWENSPFLTPLDERDPAVEVIPCTYPLIDHSNTAPFHCLHGFRQFLNARLGLDIQPTAFHGDLHVSRREKSWYSQVWELAGTELPFWIVSAGGKHDVTIKWWSPARYQAVVDHFRGRVQFVQVGAVGDHHPKLAGVIDLRGQTDLRQLVRLVYHAQGVLCGVTGLMHLAAAVETRPGLPPHRPCVVVAGGREPPHWEAYPFHQFIHTVGALPCCAHGGCWRARTEPLGDGHERDRPENLCVAVEHGLPRCMDLIPAEGVIRRIELYFRGGAIQHLARRHRSAAARAVKATKNNPFDDAPLTTGNVRLALEHFLRRRPEPPKYGRGRGIVICAGGPRYFTNAWVCLHLLRRLGCRLPIQLWHLGPEELDTTMAALVRPLGVECVDALAVRTRHPARRLGGWELKPYALLHCRFRAVLLLDADNVPVRNPEYLFSTPAYRRTGALFWPDGGELPATHPIWGWCGLPGKAAREFESGQIVVDKRRCHAALRLARWFNEHSDFFYRHLHGDKDTFQMAFRKLRQPFALPRAPMVRQNGVLYQHDFEGRRLFQHRCEPKWELELRHDSVAGFWMEEECREYVRQLRAQWDGRVKAKRRRE